MFPFMENICLETGGMLEMWGEDVRRWWRSPPASPRATHCRPPCTTHVLVFVVVVCPQSQHVLWSKCHYCTVQVHSYSVHCTEC